jgi:hypothetical protein
MAESRLESVSASAAGLTDAEAESLAAAYMIVASDESKPVAIRRWYHQLAAQLQDVLRDRRCH